MKTLLLILVLCAAIGQAQTITHIIYIIKENRSADHYFGSFPGAHNHC